jgi:hypothetical protein
MSDEEEEIHGWVKLETEDGKEYFYNPDLNLTQWEEPEEGYQVVEEEEEEEGEGGVENIEEEVVADEVEQEEEAHAYTEEDVEPIAPQGDGNTSFEPPTIDTTTSTVREYSSSSLSSISTPKRRKCRWELKETASFGSGMGNDAGDKYYLNKETGETVWEKPDDFFDDSIESNPQIIITLQTIDEDTTLEDGFDTLNLYGEDAQHELELLRSGDMSAAEACLKRLNYLEQLFQNVGSEEEWFDAIMDDE